MICFCTEITSVNRSANFDHMIIVLTLIAANNQTVFVKYLYIMKHFLQNESFLNESVCLSENHHVYDQNICFDIISCAFLAILNMQYLHHVMNSEILCINFCCNHFLI